MTSRDPERSMPLLPIYLGPIISTTTGDTDLVAMDQELPTWDPNGHVNDDVT